MSETTHYHVHCTDNDCPLDVRVAHEYAADEIRARHETWNTRDHAVDVDHQHGDADTYAGPYEDIEGY